MTYTGDGGKTMLKIASEMDGKPDTWTTQAMYEQQGPQFTQVMEAGLGSWMASILH